MKFQLTVVLLSTAILGCGNSKVLNARAPGNSSESAARSGHPSSKRLILVFCDRSQSTENAPASSDSPRSGFQRNRNLRSLMIGQVLSLAKSLNQNNDYMMVYRFGNTTRELYSGYYESKRFAEDVLEGLMPSDPIPGTNYAAVVEKASEVAKESSNKEIIVLIMGDGFFDDGQSIEMAKRYRKAAQGLLSNSRVTLVRFWGVTGDKDTGLDPRAEIRKAFEGAGDRLEILSDTQSALR